MGINLNRRDSKGETALFKAAARVKIDRLRILLNAGGAGGFGIVDRWCCTNVSAGGATPPVCDAAARFLS